MPDLSGVDLRALRAMEDPVLAAAVERILARPGALGDSWWSNEGD
ncbi:FxSxx-COOH cyclophane-containing RiPP peptide [Actinomycetota bacterium Odt1-20B]